MNTQNLFSLCGVNLNVRELANNELSVVFSQLSGRLPEQVHRISALDPLEERVKQLGSALLHFLSPASDQYAISTNELTVLQAFAEHPGLALTWIQKEVPADVMGKCMFVLDRCVLTFEGAEFAKMRSDLNGGAFAQAFTTWFQLMVTSMKSALGFAVFQDVDDGEVSTPSIRAVRKALQVPKQTISASYNVLTMFKAGKMTHLEATLALSGGLSAHHVKAMRSVLSMPDELRVGITTQHMDAQAAAWANDTKDSQ